ncbi:YdcH family protein [Jiella marina]|uniref:YdcH family protein n=1 Tax=Jiella sp. LLJ827 TaxID=2917712 RepID=UPI002100F501|nr:YdcH family protein [Jiella sp. LLJ827]MCQ0989135.1 YdcH family protein [Jiella sp. LLJ827]
MIVERKAPKLRERMRKLVERRAQIERRISDEMKRPLPDAVRLATLKRLRLRMKDEVTAISRQLRPRLPGSSRPSFS